MRMWRGLLRFLLIFCVLGAVLGAYYWERINISPTLAADIRDDVFATFRALDSQWMAVGCLTAYLFTFFYVTSLERGRRLRDSPEGLRCLCLLGLVVPALAWYGFKVAGQRTTVIEVPVLIGGLMLGQGAACWQRWQQRKGQPPGIGVQVVTALILLLTITAAWQPEMARQARYWSETRWTGMWGNPNIFGVLMAVGVVLALGRLLHVLADFPKRSNRIDGQFPKLWRYVHLVCLLAAATVMGVGLVKSYSRGAWLGAAAGISYLLWWQIRNPSSHVASPHLSTSQGDAVSMPRSGFYARIWYSLRDNAVTLTIIMVSLFLLAFWNFRHTEQRIVRRVFSAVNPDDFSWRNRTTAWKGALQIITDRPLLGWGWSQALDAYDAFYRPARISDGRALLSNDYFMTGITLGIPAMACFLGYVLLSLRRTTESHDRGQHDGSADDALGPYGHARRPSERSASALLFTDTLETTCRAGAIVLLVSFFFDGGFNGGLFTLSTGATFWILLELGRND